MHSASCVERQAPKDRPLFATFLPKPAFVLCVKQHTDTNKNTHTHTHTHTRTHAHTQSLRSGCGNHGGINAFISVRIGHPLRCLAVASGGSNVVGCLQGNVFYPACRAARSDGTSKSVHCLLIELSNRYFAIATAHCDQAMVIWYQWKKPDLWEYLGKYTGNIFVVDRTTYVKSRMTHFIRQNKTALHVPIERTLEGTSVVFLLASPFREILCKILPWAKISTTHFRVYFFHNEATQRPEDQKLQTKHFVNIFLRQDLNPFFFCSLELLQHTISVYLNCFPLLLLLLFLPLRPIRLLINRCLTHWRR